MKVHYKGVLCNLATYRVMGEDKPALYYIDSPDQETMLKAGLNKIAARWPAKALAQFYFY